jgi:hypothetical protein
VQENEVSKHVVVRRGKAKGTKEKPKKSPQEREGFHEYIHIRNGEAGCFIASVDRTLA